MIAKRLRLILAVGLSMVTAACSSRPDPPSGSAVPAGLVTITTDAGSPVELHVRIAETEQARQRGLMNVRSLAAGEGMAFLFDRPTTASFWMKDTLIPLSIAFYDGSGRIVGIREMTPCHADPCPLYSPGVPYVGAVEANRRFFASHGVAEGDSLKLVRDERALS